MYFVICSSFFYNQYLTIAIINKTDFSNFEYFVRDNSFLIILFLIILFSILSNLIYIMEYWVFKTKQEIKIKKYVGYKKTEVLKEYYFKYLLSFFISYIIATILSAVILNIWELPILFPIVLTGIVLLIVISIIVVIMIWFSLNSLEKGNIGDFKILKKIVLIFQFTVSFLLIFVALNIFQDTNKEISPYRTYRNMEYSWTLLADNNGYYSTEEEYNNYLASRGNIAEKINKVYSEFSDNMLVYFPESFYNENIGNIVYANKNIYEINLVDTDYFKTLSDTSQTPIILNHAYASKYSEGDIIKGTRTDYIVTKILKEHEKIEIVGPNDYDSLSSDQVAFALFDENTLKKVNSTDNTNFIDVLYFNDIKAEKMNEINTFLNENGVNYSLISIKATQEEYYNQKCGLVTGYLVVGITNLLFSVIGLIFILLLEINIKALDYSIMKIVGYSSKKIHLNYMLSVIFIFLTALVASLVISYLTLDFSLSILFIVLAIALMILIIIANLSLKSIKSIDPVKEIGGENV
ncbi:MAG: FtsX-like permease family protein [Bacilli bacterium]